jgi:hypothetical protein
MTMKLKLLRIGVAFISIAALSLGISFGAFILLTQESSQAQRLITPAEAKGVVVYASSSEKASELAGFSVAEPNFLPGDYKRSQIWVEDPNADHPPQFHPDQPWPKRVVQTFLPAQEPKWRIELHQTPLNIGLAQCDAIRVTPQPKPDGRVPDPLSVTCNDVEVAGTTGIMEFLGPEPPHRPLTLVTLLWRTNGMSYKLVAPLVDSLTEDVYLQIANSVR